MNAPAQMDYHAFGTAGLLTLFALAIVLIDACRKRRSTTPLGLLTAIGACAAMIIEFQSRTVTNRFDGLVYFDGFSRGFNLVFLATLALVAIGSTSEERRMRFAGEYYALLLFASVGLLFMASAGGLLMLYVGLELTTLCLFSLVGFAKREQRSAEAALKMFVVGAVASAVILYGMSLVYGAAGTTQYQGLAAAVGAQHGSSALVLWMGLIFVIGGLGFKISAVPFHLWAPDVYEGAPAAVSAFLSTASKAGGFAALIRFLLAGIGTGSDVWIHLVVVLAVLSMVVGNFVGLRQANLKRLLAYSGIAQAGYVLVAVAGCARGNMAFGVGAALMYLALYAFTNIGAFLVAQAISDATGSDEVAALRGLHKRSAPLAFAMLIILFSLGGIPPLAGFIGKIYLLAAGWQGGEHALVFTAAVVSVVSLYYYLMVALQVYIRDPEDDRRMHVSPALGVAITISIALTIAIGIYPTPWVDLGKGAANALPARAATAQIDSPSSRLVSSAQQTPSPR